MTLKYRDVFFFGVCTNNFVQSAVLLDFVDVVQVRNSVLLVQSLC